MVISVVILLVGLFLKVPSLSLISAILLIIIGATVLNSGFEVTDSLVVNDSGTSTIYQYNTTTYSGGLYTHIGLIITLIGLALCILAIFT